MVVGDFLILSVSALFLFGAAYSFFDYKKFKNNKSAKLSENEKFFLKKGQGIGIPTMLLGLIIGLGYIFVFSTDLLYLVECHGRGRCIEAHVLSWCVFGGSVFICGFVLFFFGRKKIAEVRTRAESESSVIN